MYLNQREQGAPWSQFDAGSAADLLKKAGWRTAVDDAPRQGAADFRARAAGGWAPRPGKFAGDAALGGSWAGLIAVNTSGMSESFDLKPGACISGDVPFLGVPALVNFVHSWSCQAPDNRATIAGRWLERGCYAYVGSVHEPFLQAFQPTPQFIRRLLAPSPLGVAARLDGGSPWRIAVIGDPLITIGPRAPRTAPAALPLLLCQDSVEVIAAHLRGGEFEQAFGTLVMAGRDKDALRLATAALRDQPEKLTPAAALAALPCAFRAADAQAFAALYPIARPLQDRHPAIRDMLWHALLPRAATLSGAQLDLLRDHPRPDSLLRDAEDFSKVLRTRNSDAAARSYLRSLAATQTQPWLRTKLEEMAAAK